MSAPNEATRRQIEAARPDASTWLSANAGSGKTRVLTDRVARLLLKGTDPQNILCLTYTKAAASEMQNRLFKRLGDWAMMPDVALTRALAELGVTDDVDLRKARRLFAEAIETPGGLKIQTIHSFCAGLLRRFPLEAGVSPQFKEIEDRAADLLRADVLERMAEGPDAPAVAALARLVTDEDFGKLTQRITDLGGGFQDLNLPDALALMGVAPGTTRDDVLRTALGPGDLEVIAAILPSMQTAKSKGDPVAAAGLLPLDTDDPGFMARLEGFFLTQAGTARKSFPTKPVREAHADLIDTFDEIKAQVVAARDMRLAMDAAEAAVTLHQFGLRFAAAYTDAKQKRGWLDFDDLIARARALLNDPKVAAWVLYRLDGGIDHILVDEAQDTSPAQWDVVRQLASELGAGEGAQDTERTIFVVGDKKQSIYSFQGADPEQFDRMKEAFQSRIEGAGAAFQSSELQFSFRSSPAILRVVDEVFRRTPLIEAQHVAFKSELPGRVDLWPVVEPSETEAEGDFTDPVDKIPPSHHNVVLAQRIADEIRRLLTAEETIPDEIDGQLIRRKIEPRDFLILVQRRSGIFPEIIRACKAARLPIAGADRLKVGAEMATKDIGTLLSFLSTQDDDLSLATALRSPLFGWSEQDLFTLAHYRAEKTSLWDALLADADRYSDTLRVLHELRGQTDFLRPYDLIDRMLTHHGGRAALLGRLGPEAVDGIDALMEQALVYEQTEVPSLTGFLEWMQTDDLDIKRQVDSASNQIRVMSVHGAKGLEAPIVILPDCADIKVEVRDRVIEMDGVPVWRPPASALPSAISSRLGEMKHAIYEEKMRLLYVALTRAEKWLIIAAAGKAQSEAAWYPMVQDAMGHLPAVDVAFADGTLQRVSHGDWDSLPLAERPVTERARPAAYTDGMAASAAVVRQTVAPSAITGAKVIPGPDNLPPEDAKSYGTFVHAMLEGVTPDVLLGDALRAEAVAEAQAVRGAAPLAHLFGPDVLSEVSITADLGPRRLHGTIDKLIVTEASVLAVDFKTNRVVPERAEEVPEGILRQMAAYAYALGQVYPGHRIETAIVWTKTQALMPLPHDIVTGALDRLLNLDDVVEPT